MLTLFNIYLAVATLHLLALALTRPKWRWAYKIGMPALWPFVWLGMLFVGAIIWIEGDKLEAEARSNAAEADAKYFANEFRRTDL